MFNQISENPNLFKNWILVLGLASIAFCFNLDVIKIESSMYYTYSGKVHSKTSLGECMLSISTYCQQSICTIVMITPYLGGIALTLGALVLILQIGKNYFQRYLTEQKIKTLQFIFLFLSLILTIIIPILYLQADIRTFSLCWFTIFVEFITAALISMAMYLYVKGSDSSAVISVQLPI